jgi:hypothetical protein
LHVDRVGQFREVFGVRGVAHWGEYRGGGGWGRMVEVSGGNLHPAPPTFTTVPPPATDSPAGRTR